VQNACINRDIQWLINKKRNFDENQHSGVKAMLDERIAENSILGDEK
jgi:hypothetical protein